MPTDYVKKLAKKHGTGVKTAEKKWDRAKKAAHDSDAKDDWALTTHIFKNMMGEKSSLAQIQSQVLARLEFGKKQ